MKKMLVVVDMQKDFVDGALGTAEAQEIIPAAAKVIREFEGEIFVTFDTHYEGYLNTQEGRNLPVPHCIRGTEGWQLSKEIAAALEGRQYTPVVKNAFGSTALPGLIGAAAAGEEFSIELIGLCTDICVAANALILKSAFPEAEITLRENCCAGVTPEKHKAAIETMRSCQINII